MNLNDIARIAHEVNRAYCATSGDYSLPAWIDLPDWKKVSMINAVELRLMTDSTPEEIHAAWMAKKVADGWAYGAHEDQDKKLHPYIATYSSLPMDRRIKDYLFSALVSAIKGVHP